MQQAFIKIGNKKMNIHILHSFKERVKGFRFQLKPITTGLCYPKKKSINTYFLCQNIDIIITDKEYKILYIYQNIRSEKIIFRKKHAYYIFELPAFSSTNLKIGQKIEMTIRK